MHKLLNWGLEKSLSKINDIKYLIRKNTDEIKAIQEINTNNPYKKPVNVSNLDILSGAFFFI